MDEPWKELCTAELSVNITHCSCGFPLIYVQGSLASLATPNVPECVKASKTHHSSSWQHPVPHHVFILPRSTLLHSAILLSLLPSHSLIFLSLLSFESPASPFLVLIPPLLSCVLCAVMSRRLPCMCVVLQRPGSWCGG